MFPIHDDTERIHGRPYVNYALIAINIVVFVWEAAVTDFFTNSFAVDQLFSTYGAIPEQILAGKNLLSIVTSMFMHGGIAHIIGNMVFLFVFGDNIEDRFGRIKYVLIYIAWGAIAALVHSIYALSTSGGDVPAVGASGAISAVLGAYLVMFPRAKIFTVIMAFFITTVRIPALAYIPFWFILQIVFAFIGQSGGVAYMAHIGGFAAGVGTAYLWKLFAGNFPKIGVGSILGNPVVRKERPKLEEAAPLSAPEVLEGPDYYEVIAEIKGLSDSSDIHTSYDPATKQLRIIANGSRKYDLVARLPGSATNPAVKYIHYLNGIARIRLSK